MKEKTLSFHGEKKRKLKGGVWRGVIQHEVLCNIIVIDYTNIVVNWNILPICFFIVVTVYYEESIQALKKYN
jgi:hypothetical protein